MEQAKYLELSLNEAMRLARELANDLERLYNQAPEEFFTSYGEESRFDELTPKIEKARKLIDILRIVRK